jgi:hypothetical protein
MWSMPDRSRKRPRDPNQLAKFIVDAATGAGEDREYTSDTGEDSAGAVLGRLGGLKGGRARANVLSGKRRKEIARAAAAARWGKKTK